MAAADTLWPMDDHTLGKHAVLEAYLKAWLPIMGMTQDRILFIDGFAGPGEYTGGEVGSPVIAMRALADHTAKGKFKAEVNFFFVERDRARHDHLAGLVNGWKPRLPASTQIHLHCGEFEETVGGILEAITTGKVLIPSFVMVDPFGVGQTPMTLIHRLLKNPKVEIFVSVMYDFVNRFRGQPEFEGPLDALYGTPHWRDAIPISDGDRRRHLLYDLYKSQLRAGGAKHVVHFDLYRKGRPVYAIFHATKHHLGCDKMKEAIWKMAPWGDYAFRPDANDAGMDFFGLDMSPFKKLLRQRFGGREASVEELAEFVCGEQCPFYSGQLKGVLREMEQTGDLAAVDGTRKRKGTYPDGTRLILTPL